MSVAELDRLNNADRFRGVTAVDGSTKARIERAAISLYTEQSVDAVTTNQIASLAGYSEATLYRHYASKEDIGFSIFLAIHERLGDLVLAARGAGEALEDQVQALVLAYCDTADDDWQLFSFHLLNMNRYLPQLPKNKRNPVDAAEALVKQAIKAGQIPKGDVRLRAAMVLGVVLQPALHKAYGRHPGKLGPMKEKLTSAVLGVLRA